MYRIELSPEQLLHIIFDYTSQITLSSRLDQILQLMANMGKEMILADRCTVWLIDNEKQELYTTIAHGVDHIRIPLGSGIVGAAIASGQSILIDDAYRDSRHNAENDLYTGYHTKAIITVPFRNNDNKIIGAYQAINKLTEDAVFSERDLEYLTLAASYAGKSLESFLLHQEIIDTQREIISIIGQIGELRSQETANHVKRVAQYSYLLALAYGLNDKDAELLRDVSPMHDIGKIAIPDDILNKPNKLTEDEYNLIKTHTLIGHKLLGSSKRQLMHTAAIVSQQHHEKWDGTGYPNGLRGEEIHIFGRITAIADVFDALSVARVYKSAWSIEEIKQFFHHERGKHFDPDIVDVFFRILPELLHIRDQLIE